MPYRVCTHDSWGVVPVGAFPSLEEARQAFEALCRDPWYSQDGTVRGVELLEQGPDGASQRLAWFAFSQP
ncbi:MAG: hypothetical protein VKK62_08615 [Synechococcaceae cyanobacterium]|nr:hypothetical protein [Synechococcaceae cyanobacterium]